MKRVLIGAMLVSAVVANAAFETTVYNNTPFAGLVNTATSTSSGFYLPGSASANQAGNQITRLVADDINVGAGYGGWGVRGMSWVITNGNTTAVSLRMRLRFYDTTGAGGGPGAVLAGFTFNPLTQAVGENGWSTSSATNLFVIPTSGKFWAGITFDNNVGATGATAAQLDNVGSSIYSGPAVGSSADNAFETTAAGSFFAANPAGSQFNFGAAGPRANFAWRFDAVPEPASFLAIGLGVVGIAAARRRKK